MNHLIGKQLGEYKVVKMIGAGGMGEVYLAEHVHLGKRYALKMLAPDLAQDETFRRRFVSEAKFMAEMQHPHIVQVHTMAESDGMYYLVMDYVTGPDGESQSLFDVITGAPGNRADQEQVQKWATQIADALEYAHGLQVVHRDLKPANILLDENGDARLTDFGLAKTVGENYLLDKIEASFKSIGPEPTIIADTDGITQPFTETLRGNRSSQVSSSLVGTYDYISPEQRDGHAASVQSDLYAFGVILYRLLTGKRPMGMADPPSAIVPSLAKSWDSLVGQCLKTSPSDRPSSASVLRQQLRAMQHTRKNRRMLVAGAGVVAIVASASLAFMGGSGELRATAEHERVKAHQSRDLAKDAQASQYAPDTWGTGDAKLREGERHFEDEDFKLAITAWALAAQHFDDSARSARGPLNKARGLALESKSRTHESMSVAQREKADEYAIERWTAALNADRVAQEHYDAGRYKLAAQEWNAATSHFETSAELAGELGGQMRQQQQAAALDAKSRAHDSMGAAQRENAKENATELWNAALNADQIAQEHYDAGRYELAAQEWNAATNHFETSAELAGELGGQMRQQQQAAALDAKSRAQDSMGAAQRENAKENATELWNAAIEDDRLAQDHYDAGRYELAAESWKNAHLHSESCIALARSMHDQECPQADNIALLIQDTLSLHLPHETQLAPLEHLPVNCADRVSSLSGHFRTVLSDILAASRFAQVEASQSGNVGEKHDHFAESVTYLRMLLDLIDDADGIDNNFRESITEVVRTDLGFSYIAFAEFLAEQNPPKACTAITEWLSNKGDFIMNAHEDRLSGLHSSAKQRLVRLLQGTYTGSTPNTSTAVAMKHDLSCTVFDDGSLLCDWSIAYPGTDNDPVQGTVKLNYDFTQKLLSDTDGDLAVTMQSKDTWYGTIGQEPVVLTRQSHQ
jgi:tRNA A-37 threonylcarbamoyl transferase component Bud32